MTNERTLMQYAINHQEHAAHWAREQRRLQDVTAELKAAGVTYRNDVARIEEAALYAQHYAAHHAGAARSFYVNSSDWF